MRALGKTVGVVSVDPSSPFTHGALLGDRIRLTDHFLDPGVFIRSMGSRGHAGGLAESTLQALLLLDASGKDVVFLETVGTGQSDVGVLSIADTVVLALMPGSGDSVQALKAGIMEIPDVIAINKSDHPEARQTANDVRQVLALAPSAPQPPIVLTEALRGEGIDALWDTIAEHRAGLERDGAARGTPPAQPRDRGVRGRVGASAPAPRDRGRRRPGAAAAARPRSNGGSSIRSPPCIRSSRTCSTSPTPIDDRDGPTLADIEAARERIGDRALRTPVYGSETLLSRTGRAVLLKAENLQRTGSFKIRGAVNVLASLTPAEREAGVIAASAGNHGQAVASAARELGVRATILMPQDAPMSKVDPTLRYGAEAVLFGPTFDDALAEAHRRVEETGATFIHAFEDERVIAGQGTIGLELAEQLGDVETVLIPVGGGGLASGIAIALRALRPGIRLVGVQRRARRPHDRRRHRREVPRRDDDGDPRRPARRARRRSATRRSARRSRSCSSGRSSSSRARARSASLRC